MKRARRGRYIELQPTLKHLYINQGVPARLIAKHLNLNTRTLEARVSEWGWAELRAERHARILHETTKDAA